MSRTAIGPLKTPIAFAAGQLRHVDDVSANDGPFVCPGCANALRYVRKSGPIAKAGGEYHRRSHFAHAPDQECAHGLETGLHLWAKDLIERRLSVALPAHVLRHDGAFLHELTFHDDWTFDRAACEEWKVGLRPDIVLYRGLAELHVEIRVTHAVDATKIEALRQRNIAAIEIDLSSLDGSELSREQLDEAILVTAPRSWLHHELATERQAIVDREYGALLKPQAEAFRALIEKPQAGLVDDAYEEHIEYYGLAPYLDRTVPHAFWFEAAPRYWQWIALLHYVVNIAESQFPADMEVPYRGKLLKETIGAAWLQRRSDLDDHPHPDLLAAAGLARDSYGTPQHAIAAYFDLLCGEPDRDTDNPLLRRLISPGSKPDHFVINPTWLGYVRRRHQLEKAFDRATGHFSSIPFREWLKHKRDAPAELAVTHGSSPRQLCLAGGPDFFRLVAHLDALANAAAGGTRAPAKWGLTSPRAPQSPPEDGVYRCRSTAILREQGDIAATLQQIATSHFCSRNAAARFLAAPHADLGGLDPLTFSIDLPTLQRCIALMPRLPGQHGRRRLW